MYYEKLKYRSVIQLKSWN